MELYINYKSSCHMLPADPRFSIFEVKTLLENFIKAPASKMALQFNDKILSDKRTLKECGIKSGNELTLMLKNGEGGCLDMLPFDENKLKQTNSKTEKMKIVKEAIKRFEIRLKEYSKENTKVTDLEYYLAQSWHWTKIYSEKKFVIGIQFDSRLDDDWKENIWNAMQIIWVVAPRIEMKQVYYSNSSDFVIYTTI